MQDLYHQQLLEEANSPQNRGKLVGEGVSVVTQYNASCGDKVTLYLELDATKTKIIQVKWEGLGCIISQASMSVLSNYLINRSISDIKNIKVADVLDLLGLVEIAPGRVKCLELGVKAVQKAVG